jgi:hypothetical protein
MTKRELDDATISASGKTLKLSKERLKELLAQHAGDRTKEQEIEDLKSRGATLGDDKD